MDDVIKLLKEMGAVNVTFSEGNNFGGDGSLLFEFGGKVDKLYGHYGDDNITSLVGSVIGSKICPKCESNLTPGSFSETDWYKDKNGDCCCVHCCEFSKAVEFGMIRLGESGMKSLPYGDAAEFKAIDSEVFNAASAEYKRKCNEK